MIRGSSTHAQRQARAEYFFRFCLRFGSPIPVVVASIERKEISAWNFFMLALFTCLIKKGIEMHVAERPKFPSTELFIAIRDSEFISLASLLNLQTASGNSDGAASFHIKPNTWIGGE